VQQHLSFRSLVSCFSAFFALGLSSFGGPAAHIGYFQREFVQRRQWLSAAEFSYLTALSHFLPGPSSSQLGFAIGLHRAGVPGAFVAWLGFTLPSAFLMYTAALGFTGLAAAQLAQLSHWLGLVAIAVVIHASWNLYQQLCRQRLTQWLMPAALALMWFWPGFIGQLVALITCSLFAVLHQRPTSQTSPASPPCAGANAVHASAANRTTAMRSLLMLALLATLFALLQHKSAEWGLAYLLFRAGALVMGGGHVVLPLIQTELAQASALTTEQLFAGYAAAQAMPGPLFSIAAFLGALVGSQPALGATLAILAIFLPGLLLVLVVMPQWQRVQHNARLRHASLGIGSAVVAMLVSMVLNQLGTLMGSGAALELTLVGMMALLLLKQLPAWWLVLVAILISAW